MSFERVGSSQPITVDVRILAATHQDLEAMIDAGRFREDLYYRINVFSLRTPSLRERREDIFELAVHFLGRHAQKMGKAVTHLDDEAVEALVAYDWPGNIRELQNIIERAAVLSSGRVLELGPDLLPVGRPVGAVSARPEAPADAVTLEEMERRHIRAALERSRWVVEGPAGAAKALGLHPNTLRSRMSRLGITRPPHRIS
jgi:formate hydrogenlyase transcriptional activator